MSLRRRRLLLFAPDHHGDCEIWGSHACSSPPAPPPLVPPPSPSPSPLSFAWPCPPLLPPSPSPALDGAVGRTNQGYGTAGGADDHRRRIVTIVLITAAALVFISLILLGVSVATRRRQQRRRRQQAALLAPATPAAVTNVEGGSGGGEGGGGGVVHHVWYIRTVGLDEAAIDSIAATRYRAGAGLLGAADCSVCLGEFQDGELVRLLPKCSHAFHVPCIDTWLRAHVNCPLCRSDVLGPIATVADEGSESSSTPRADPDADTVAAAEQAAATVDAISEHEGEQEEEDEQEAPRVEEDQHEQQFSLPEPSPQLLPSPPPRNVRRAASMDAAIVSAAVDVARLPEAAPEEEQRGGAKRDAGASCVKVSSSGHVGTERPPPPRSFFSRHCRARSSVLPL